MTRITPAVARVALPYIRELKDEIGDPDDGEWQAVFQVQLELERIIKEAEEGAAPRVYCEHTGVLLGLIWPRDGGYYAEERHGRQRWFMAESHAHWWLRERARATLGPAWAATVDARALGDAA